MASWGAPVDELAHFAELRHRLRGWVEALYDALLPQECAVCGTLEGPGSLAGLCSGCCSSIERWPGAAEGDSRAVVAARFRPPVRDLVLGLKYAGRREAAIPLAALIASAADPAELRRRVDALVPIPSHPLKRWSRGLDPAEEIAAALADMIGVPCKRGLVRTRRTQAQGQARSARQRARQVAGAFRALGWVEGRRIALVDDVLTSGATASAAREALEQRGATVPRVLAAAGHPWSPERASSRSSRMSRRN